jgi:hypothetical protein
MSNSPVSKLRFFKQGDKSWGFFDLQYSAKNTGSYIGPLQNLAKNTLFRKAASLNN